VFAALVAVASPSVALLAVVALSTVGTLSFAGSLRSGDTDRAAARPEARRAALRYGGMRLLLLVAVLLGGVIGGIQVAAPTFAAGHHARAAAGVLIAAVSVGGIVGAGIYGSRRWRSPAAARLVVLLGALTAIVALAGLAGDVVVLGGFLLVAGLPLNPSLTTLSLLVDQHIPASAAGEAFGWLSTGLAGGTGVGSAIAATLAQHQRDARTALTVAAVAGAASVAVAAGAFRYLRRQPTVVSE
jgi:predicted MFS family arabinose efflux permease